MEETRPLIRVPGGLFTLAALVGVAAGLGAVGFRSLIATFTWIATGHAEFGQQGRIPSGHLPWLGSAFYLVIPVVGGLLYGQLISRWAREARGSGVPEVMYAVAREQGRVRPRVGFVRALATSLCLATGGSVGREGPIVHIGASLASGIGQWLRQSGGRTRILVACGVAGGISATFNAPVTGVLYSVELILRTVNVKALAPIALSAVLAEAVAEPILGSGRSLRGFPTENMPAHAANYLLVVALAVVAALIGIGFTAARFKIEDVIGRLWGDRPEWAKPAVGGVLIGLILLAVPQLYGSGYPVMTAAISGRYALWFLVLLTVGKLLATSVTLGVGGSGGVFGPCLFLGATSGTAYGLVVDHMFGPTAGPPGLYAVVAMGAVFAAAAQAPLTSLASAVEMTGSYALTLPVLLAVAIAAAISRALRHGSIYTTSLLRKGIDLDEAAP
jgi:CIC family chloride channel protein